MKLTPASKEQLSKIKVFYEEAFPRQEQKQFSIMLEKQREGLMEILAIHQDNEILGLAIMMLHKDLALLDYFAISSAQRSQGLGAKALSLLKERYHDKRFILEIESPNEQAKNNLQRIRRKDFYLRNGLTECNLPIYLFGIDMEILSDHCAVTFSEYFELYQHVLGEKMVRDINPSFREANRP